MRYEGAEKYPAVFYPTISLSNKSVYVIGIDENALVTSATTLIIKAEQESFSITLVVD